MKNVFFLLVLFISSTLFSQKVNLAFDLNKKLFKDNSSGKPKQFKTFNNKLYMTIAFKSFGEELCMFSGDGKPILIADINKVSPEASSEIEHLTIYKNKLYFSATNGINGKELWVYDGVGSPKMIRDINEGLDGSFPSDLYVFNNKLYFTADDGISGSELWVYDETSTSTPSLVADINKVGNSDPNFKIIYKNKLFFSADDGIHGNELWSYDGNNPPVLEQDLLKAIAADGDENGQPENLTVFNGDLYFGARHTFQAWTTNQGLVTRTSSDMYKYDGKNASELVYDNRGDAYGPQNLTVYNNKLYFTDREFFEGPYRIRKVLKSIDTSNKIKTEYRNVDNTGGNASLVKVFNNKLYFAARANAKEFSLFEINNTNSPKIIVSRGSMKNITTANDLRFIDYVFYDKNIYFSAEQSKNEWEVWKYNFVNDSEVAWNDFMFDETKASNIYDLKGFKDKIYFSGDDGIHGKELWGFKEGSEPFLVSDINDGAGDAEISLKKVEFKDNLYFGANNGINGKQLYVYDGINTPVLAYDLSNINGMVFSSALGVIGNKLYFQLKKETEWYFETWSLDDKGTLAKDEKLTVEFGTDKSHLNKIIFKDKFYFIREVEDRVHKVIIFDGNSTLEELDEEYYSPPTLRITNNELILRDSNFDYLYNESLKNFEKLLNYPFSGSYLLGKINGDRCYRASNYKDKVGDELYVTSSITNETNLYDIWEGKRSGVLARSIVYNNILYFAADEGVNGVELWSYDGSNPPKLVENINTGINTTGNMDETGSRPDYFYIYNDKLFFTAYSNDVGRELRFIKVKPIVKRNLNITAINGYVTTNPNSVSGEYNDGTEVTLMAIPNVGFQFDGWSGDVTGADISLSITMDVDKTIVATFSRIKYNLEITATNGSVTTSPNPVNETYESGTEVILTSVPDEGYQFDGWSGDATGTDISLNIIMDADKTVVANFSKIQYNLDITAVNGSVTTNLNPVNGTYESGTKVILTATPDAGYQFDGWNGDITGIDTSLNITMDEDKTVVAIFNKIKQDDDKDGVFNDVDLCPDSVNGSIVDANGCAQYQLVNIEPNDIKVVVSGTTCPGKRNGIINVSFTKDYTYQISLIGGTENRTFDYIKYNSGLEISNVPVGTYEICVTSSDLASFKQCYNAVIKAPESLKVSKASLKGKLLTYQVSGSTNYRVTVNSKKYFFSFDDTSLKEIELNLLEGNNSVEIKTDKVCQGSYHKSIINKGIVLYPVPAKEYLNILGVTENMAEITIRNLVGAIVLSTTINVKNGIAKLPLNNIVVGTYFITITTSTQTMNAKILKK